MILGQILDVRQWKPERILFIGLVLLLAWCPLPFGSNRLWSESLLNVGGALLLGGCAIVALRTDGFAIPLQQVAVSAGLFAAALVWAMLQWSPWTPEFLHHPIWAMTSEALQVSYVGRITVNPDATLTSAVGLLGYASIFWVAMQLSTNRQNGVIAIKALALISAVYACYGLVVFLSGNKTILIFDKWEYTDALSSTFVNRNNFATFAGMGLVCASAVLLRACIPILQSKARSRIKIAQTLEIVFIQSWPYLVAAFGLLAALMLTGSRAGIGSTGIALVVLTVLMLRSRRLGVARLLGSAAVVLVIFATVALPFSGLLSTRLDRADSALTENGRIEVYRLTLFAIGDAPVTGTGLGTFPDIFPYYRDAEVFTSSAWVKAHNTYLETILELGIPAALAIFAAIGILGWNCAKGVRKFRERKIVPAVAASATVLVGVHSLLDFSMQIPAIAAVYSALLGFGVGIVTQPSKSKARTGASRL